jgi:hypothetical protein
MFVDSDVLRATAYRQAEDTTSRSLFREFFEIHLAELSMSLIAMLPNYTIPLQTLADEWCRIRP